MILVLLFIKIGGLFLYVSDEGVKNVVMLIVLIYGIGVLFYMWDGWILMFKY